MNKIDKLRDEYVKICNLYVQEFCEKQELEFMYWINDDVGGIFEASDYFFSFADIVYDINSNQPKGLILKWSDECIINHPKAINYYSYTIGLTFKDLE
jgi:hypothetical protein